GTDMGVYSAAQGSDSWTRLGAGLPNSAVLDLRLNPNGSQLVAATHGRGVWTYSFGAPAAAVYQAKPLAPQAPAPVAAVKAPSGALAVTGGLPLVSAGLVLLAAAGLLQGVRRLRRR
ncbi:MAG: hypothetical protein ACYDB7_04455, partial [Mycobacteriales bacterium]